MTKLTEQELEHMLHDAFIIAAAKQYDEIPDDVGHTISRKYQRKFDKMLKDPFGYAEHFQKDNKTAIQHIRHYALVAILILAILTGTIFAIPQTRSIAVDLIRQWFEDHVTFSYSGSSNDFVLPEIEISYIPEGYDIVYKDTDESEIIKKYENHDKTLLSIYVYVAGGYFSTSLDNELCEIYDIKLDNCVQAQMYEAYDDDQSSDLVWTSKDGKLFFLVHGKLPPKELMKIANGIKY